MREFEKELTNIPKFLDIHRVISKKLGEKERWKKEDKRTDAHTYPLKQSSKWTRLAAVRRRHNWKVRLYHVSRNIWSLRELPCPRYIRVYTMRCRRILNVWWIFRGKKEKSLAGATVKINCACGMPHAYRIQAKILAEKMQKELFPPSFTER